jgi:homoserine O-succinyltransferase
VPLDAVLPDRGRVPTRRAGPGISCAFVNNMPDSAFVATERQVLGLLEAGGGPDGIDVGCYALPGVPRGDRIAERINTRYLPLEHLWDSAPQVVVISGSEPLSATLEAEPYWEELVHLLEFVTDQGAAVLLSCLAAHAALLVFDSLPRVRLSVKCSGVFPQDLCQPHPLAVGLRARLVMPHSRLNDVPLHALRAAGYEVLIASGTVGWSVATKQVGWSQLLLVQGHPEYDPSSLLREYHRDVQRYQSGAAIDPPVLPTCCVAPEDEAALHRFHRQLLSGAGTAAAPATFGFEEAAGRAGWPWRGTAIQLFANLLAAAATRVD